MIWERVTAGAIARRNGPVARWALLRWALLLAVLPGVAGLTGCSSTKKYFKPSESQQKQLGQQAAQEISQQYKLVQGAPLERVQRVGQKLLSALPASQRDSWDFNFHVIDSTEVNAFALPGGNIYIFTGLLNRLTDDSELAAVLGHEMAHVYLQHWADQVAADQQRSAGLAVLLGAINANQGAYTAAGVLNTLVDLRYSRKDEDQADANGLTNMYHANYDPNGMLRLFQVLQQAGGSSGTPAFLQDHPLTQQRIDRTKQRIAQLKQA